MPRCKELAEALEIIETPVETETRCSKCRFRNNTTLWSCAYIDIVGVSKRLAFPHALPQELCETEGYPCIAFQEGERQDSPFRSISRLSKGQGRRSRQAQEKEFLRLYEGGIADRQTDRQDHRRQIFAGPQLAPAKRLAGKYQAWPPQETII